MSDTFHARVGRSYPRLPVDSQPEPPAFTDPFAAASRQLEREEDQKAAAWNAMTEEERDQARCRIASRNLSLK